MSTAAKPARINFADIKEKLLERVEELVRELVPGGSKQGIYWMAKNPTRTDRHAGSFWIILTGRSAGVWKDEATGDDGDIISLIAYCKGHTDLKETRAFCLAYLGGELVPMSAAERTEQDKKLHARREKEAERAAAELAQKRKSAFGLWLNGVRDVRGTPVETYLRDVRGIDLTEMGFQPGSLRYLPNHKHTGDGGVESYWPCMAVAMHLADGQIGAVHRTWLTQDGSDKAPVCPARKIFPSFKGAVARISKGITGLSPEEAAKAGKSGPVVITEGIEDALSVALACPELRVWAAGSLGNMANVPMLPCVSRVILCADNDWDTPEAIAQFETVFHTLQANDLPLTVVRSTVGKDLNDLLRAGALTKEDD